MKFVADAMLGRLARWMRFLGYDVIYLKNVEDSYVVRVARSQDRILLTRDRGIPLHFKVNCLLIHSEDIYEQLKQLLKEFPPSNNKIRRCMDCNEPLLKIDKEEVKEQVPEYIWIHQQEFCLCPKCRKIFWEGTHVKKMLQHIEQISAYVYEK